MGPWRRHLRYATFVGTTLDGGQRLESAITLDIDPDDFSGAFEDAVVDAINAAADCLTRTGLCPVPNRAAGCSMEGCLPPSATSSPADRPAATHRGV